jgi:membrane protein YqaA with SNARE-associated domain
MAIETFQVLQLIFGRVAALARPPDLLHFRAGLAWSLPETVKLLFVRYSEFIWDAVQPLGSWAVFAVAGIDSAFFGFPLDPLVAGYIYRDHARFLLYSAMAAGGSAIGSLVLYAIGYKGGEVLLLKRIPPAKFAGIRRSFDRHEFWALMFPSMMPPPFPFKLFVLAASVFEMNLGHFLLAIFAGRLVRFLILSVLVLTFGQQAVALSAALIERHWLFLLLALPAVVGLYTWIWYRARQKDRSLDAVR